MQSWDKVRLRLRSLLRRGLVERELETELGFHVDEQIEENLAAGMTAPGQIDPRPRQPGK